MPFGVRRAYKYPSEFPCEHDSHFHMIIQDHTVSLVYFSKPKYYNFRPHSEVNENSLTEIKGEILLELFSTRSRLSFFPPFWQVARDLCCQEIWRSSRLINGEKASKFPRLRMKNLRYSKEEEDEESTPKRSSLLSAFGRYFPEEAVSISMVRVQRQQRVARRCQTLGVFRTSALSCTRPRSRGDTTTKPPPSACPSPNSASGGTQLATTGNSSAPCEMSNCSIFSFHQRIKTKPYAWMLCSECLRNHSEEKIGMSSSSE